MCWDSFCFCISGMHMFNYSKYPQELKCNILLLDSRSINQRQGATVDYRVSVNSIQFRLGFLEPLCERRILSARVVRRITASLSRCSDHKPNCSCNPHPVHTVSLKKTTPKTIFQATSSSSYLPRTQSHTERT